VILFELLTKRPAFHAGKLEDLVDLVVNTPPANVASLRPDVPAELAAIVDRCLTKSAAQRFPDVFALCLALEPFGLGRRPSTPIRLVNERREREITEDAIESAPTISSDSSPAAPPPPPDLRVLRRFGNYIMYTALGGGGMASVHFGVQLAPDAPPQPVALKVLRAELASQPTATAIMVDEAR